MKVPETNEKKLVVDSVKAERSEFVAMDKWGRDHWSTLAYVETRCVDHSGKINHRNMRCDPDRHPLHAHEATSDNPPPTRLKGGLELSGHDDWDCLDDMEELGLLTTMGVMVALTDKGFEVASALRKHIARGGNSGNFEYVEKTKNG